MMALPLKFLADIFLSTPSVRRATCFSSPLRLIVLFLSTPSVRRATFWIL